MEATFFISHLRETALWYKLVSEVRDTRKNIRGGILPWKDAKKK